VAFQASLVHFVVVFQASLVHVVVAFQEISLKAEKVWQKKTGRPSKLSTEDQLLITLEYWREYRTYFHLGNSWGINESTAYRIVRKVENILIKSGLFNLPGKKALLESNSEIEVIVVDVSEQEIERPKKKTEIIL